MMLFSVIIVKKVGESGVNDDSRSKHKAISGCLSDYFGFKLSENGTVFCLCKTFVA